MNKIDGGCELYPTFQFQPYLENESEHDPMPVFCRSQSLNNSRVFGIGGSRRNADFLKLNITCQTSTWYKVTALSEGSDEPESDTHSMDE